jgi:serine/threonine-protein kinase
VLYTMIAGRGPFDHFEGDQRLLSAHALEDPTPPSQFNDVPAPSLLDAVILKGLAKNPADRYQSALEFKQELERVGEALYRPVGWVETTSFDMSTLDLSPVPALPGEPQSVPTAVLPVVAMSVPVPEAAPLTAQEPAQPIERPSRPAPTYLVAVVFVAATTLAALLAAGVVILIRSRL